MPLIDRTYFDGPVLLDISNNHAAIDAAIGLYEDVYLQAVLGPTLYAAFATGLGAVVGGFSDGFSAGFASGTVDARWDYIRDGHTFTYGGRSYTWPGLVTPKRSPLANYIYANYLRELIESPGSSGYTTTPQPDKTIVASPRRAVTRAWNQMVDWHGVLFLMLTTLETAGAPTYPEFDRYELVTAESIDVYNTLGL